VRSNTRLVAQAIVLVAIGVALAPFTSFPVGIAKVNPTQHFVNVVMGVGTLLAFPGGMIGAFLAGYVYRFTRNVYLGALGEIIGTGIIGAVVSALLVAPVFMGQTMAMSALIASFLASTVVGSVIGVLALRLLERAGFVELGRQSSSA
jgi:predicted membrane protein